MAMSLDGKVTSWNPAAARLFGYDGSEILVTYVLRVLCVFVCACVCVCSLDEQVGILYERINGYESNLVQ